MKILALVLMAVLQLVSQAFAKDIWYEFEPATVELTGVIQLEKRFGPPGYGEDPNHDEKVTIRVLALSIPINVKGQPDDLTNSETHLNVRKIQLVVKGPVKKFVNKKVRVKGSLFQGHTGHHYTDVLITVDSIKAISN